MARVELDEDCAGRSYRAASGDVVVIRLAETPTSGYRWELDSVDSAVLAPAGDSFRPAGGAGLGGGGERELRFSAAGPGTTRLRLALRRGWAAGDRAARRFEVTVHVSASG